MTTRDERQASIQTFIDQLTPGERHRVNRALNARLRYANKATLNSTLRVYNVDYLLRVYESVCD